MRILSILILLVLFACSPSSESATEEVANTSSPEETVEVNHEEELIYEEAPIEEPVELSTENNNSEEYEDIDWDDYMASMTQNFSFVIIISTKSYDAALERAQDASDKLGYPLNLRDLVPNEEMGLTLPREICSGICGDDSIEFPQYLPRSDYGDSKYVSVEYSNGFDGFNPGYYIVVIASGEKGDPVVQEALEEAQQYYDDAYAKTCGVWMGCGC
ncbi:MAG: hypothetical protein ACI8ZM_003137 [Crocinitomix sp.]|jgi:hypothetical protein